MIHLPYELYIQAQAKMAEYEAEAEQERLLRKVSSPADLRVQLALLVHQLAARLAPEPPRPSLKRSRQY